MGKTLLFIRLDVRSLLSDEIVVREMRISSPVVYLEQKLPDNTRWWRWKRAGGGY